MGCRSRNSPYIYQNRGDGTNNYCSKCSNYYCKCLNYGASAETNLLQQLSNSPKRTNTSNCQTLDSSQNYTSTVDLQRDSTFSTLDLHTSVDENWNSTLTTDQSSQDCSSIATEPCRSQQTSVISSPRIVSASPTHSWCRTYCSTSPKYSYSSLNSCSSSSSSTFCESKEHSSECSPDVESSPVYYSTSPGNSRSSLTYTLSSVSRCNSPTSRNYIPLSPASTTNNRTFDDDFSPISSKYSSISPFSSLEYRPISPNYSYNSPSSSIYSLNSPPYPFKNFNCMFSPVDTHKSKSSTFPKYRSPRLDYSFSSPQSPTRSNSSQNSIFSLKYVPVSSASKSSTFINDSPTSPVYSLSSPSCCPYSPDYFTDSPNYSSSESLTTTLKSPSSPRCKRESPMCPYSPKYTPEYSPYKDKPKSTMRYGVSSPTFYPLSPDDSPEHYPSSTFQFNGRSIPDDDIPCICCSPTPPEY